VLKWRIVKNIPLRKNKMKTKFFVSLLFLVGISLTFLNAQVNKVDKFDAMQAYSYQENCDNKIAKGCFYVGIGHFIGEGFKKDDSKAYEYLRKASSLEPKNAQYISTIARMDFYNYKMNDDAKHMNEALELFKQACVLKDADSCNALGSIYETGENTVAVDYAKAGEYYKKSCDLRNNEGCTKIKTAKNR